MPSALAQAGAISDPSRSAPLYTSRIVTGIWTNRSPLRDAATSLYMERYGLGRQDSILDGINLELASKLTLIRRPGCSLYNTQLFPAIDRFYEFRKFSTSVEQIQVIADTRQTVYDATGPDTKVALWQKGPGSARTTFQSVGNVMYFGNGVDQKKYVQSTLAWMAKQAYTAGQYLIDANGLLQAVQDVATSSIVTVGISNNVATFTLQAAPTFPTGASITTVGMTAVPALNAQTLTVTGIAGSIITANFVSADVPTISETGTLSTSAPTISGSVIPLWGSVVGQSVVDAGIIWLCKGPAVSDWMFAAPTSAPTLSQAALPTLYPQWKANTLYSSSLQIVGGGNLQKLTTDGVTGSAEPVWDGALYGTTQDGTAIWTNIGAPTWEASTDHAIGDGVSVTFTYYIYIDNNPDQDEQQNNGYNQGNGDNQQQVPVTVTDFFVCTTAGYGQVSTPAWVDGVGSIVQDGTAIWTNVGSATTWASVGAGQSVALEQTILDSNGYLQTIATSGKSGAMAPTWSLSPGAITTDNTASWTNAGSYAAAASDQCFYSYSFGNSLTFDESSRSPLSVSLTRGANMLVNIQGSGSTDSQVDTIYIYRTLIGGSSQLRLATIPAPAPGALWTYTDTKVDSQLNPLIQASTTNNPPPAGLTALTYHISRIWGAVNNVVYFSATVGAGVGVSVSSFPPLNSFTFPSQVVRLWPTTIGLLVFTVSDLYIITGDIATTALASLPFIPGMGLRSYDAFAVSGTTIYLYTSDYELVALDPSAGITENGFPIADILEASSTGEVPAGLNYDPSTAYLTFHSQGSSDKALYVGDGATGWFRMAATTAPESGFAWSPRAVIGGGVQAIKSVEVSPGTRKLLLGPATNGPILARDITTRTDNTVPYACDVTFGSIVLAQPGEVAGLRFITLDSPAIGTRATIGLLLGEISGTFETLDRTRQDPPNLPPSQTLYNDRYAVEQNANPIWCRHFQMKISWPAEDAKTELYSFAIYGELKSESKAG
jgi:hypothetical protein